MFNQRHVSAVRSRAAPATAIWDGGEDGESGKTAVALLTVAGVIGGPAGVRMDSHSIGQRPPKDQIRAMRNGRTIYAFFGR